MNPPRTAIAVATGIEVDLQVVTRTFIGVTYLASVVGVIGVLIVSMAGLSFAAAPAPLFAAVNDASNSVALTWTAPGDDGGIGTATQYDVRYSTATITEGNWAAATPVVGEPAPLPAGTAQGMTVSGLLPSTTYYFALKTGDEVPNWSALSNIAQRTTAAAPPVACTESWSCTAFSACSAEGSQSRTCSDANACGTTAFRPALTQACTPTPAPVACTESWSCTAWTACGADGLQSRTCSDANACGTTVQKPGESRACTPPPPVPTTVQSSPTTRYDGSDSTAASDDGRGPEAGYIVTAPANLGAFSVQIFDTGGRLRFRFQPFGASQRGLSVATGDVDGDGVNDIVVGQRSGPNREVRVFSTTGRLKGRFFGYPADWGTGLELAVADVNGDGREDILAAPVKGRPYVSAYTFAPTRNRFFLIDRIVAFAPSFLNGVSVAAGNLEGDGTAEVVVGMGEGVKGIVRTFRFNPVTLRFEGLRQFQPYGTRFNYRIVVGVGEVTADGKPDILIVSGPGAAPIVRALTPTGRLQKEFYAASRAFRGGVRLTTVDTDRDGVDEVVTAAYQQGASGVYVWRYSTEARAFQRANAFLAYTPYANGLTLSGYTE